MSAEASGSPEHAFNDAQRAWILFQLREASEQIRQTLAALASAPHYTRVEFAADMEHAYHHLNTAWNARAATPAQLADDSEERFYAWRQFPTDLPLD